MAIESTKPQVLEASVRYQAETKLLDLALEIASNRVINWDKVKKAAKIWYWLAGLDAGNQFLDATEKSRIIYKLIEISGITEFPTAPDITPGTAPAILIGTTPGPAGTDGTNGTQGPAGLATDFRETNMDASIQVDNFLVTDAKGARWDYVVVGDDLSQRVGTVRGTWSADGSNIRLSHTSSGDIGDTSGITFTVEYSTGSIYLTAIITSGTWTVEGARYFIPNNGNGTGPINASLPEGQIYIGNVNSVAAAQTMSGDVTMDLSGGTTISNDVITNAKVASDAAIEVTKLETLTADRVVGTDSSGVLTPFDTATYPSIVEFARVKGVTSPIQDQIDGKMTDPMTTIGDIIIRNASNNTVRLAIGASSDVLTVVAGVPTWQAAAAGFADPMTTSGDIIIRSGVTTTRLPIGSAGQVLAVSAGLPAWTTLAGYTDPLTTNGDLLVRDGGVTTRLAAGTANQVLRTSGTASSWATITAGATNELQKNGGSGAFSSSGVFATSTGLGIGTSSPGSLIHAQLSSSSTAAVIRVEQDGTANVGYIMTRTGGTVSSWSIYLPGGSTDVRMNNGSDRFTFGSAGAFTATAGLTGTTLTLSSVPANDNTQGQILVRNSSTGLINYRTAASIGFVNPLTTDGDLIVMAGGLTTRLAAGTANQVLRTSGTASSWATLPAGSAGDFQVNDGSGGFATPFVRATFYGSADTIRVGIGTVAPTQKLDVEANASSGIIAGRFAASDTGRAGVIIEREGAPATKWTFQTVAASTSLELLNDVTSLFSYTTTGKFTAESLAVGSGSTGLDILNSNQSITARAANAGMVISGSAGTSGTNNAGGLSLYGGNAYQSSGNGNGGNIYLIPGLSLGSGSPGDVVVQLPAAGASWFAVGDSDDDAFSSPFAVSDQGYVRAEGGYGVDYLTSGDDEYHYYLTKIIEIGSWDMDGTISVTVAHELADFTKIRRVSCMVINDAGTTMNTLEISGGGVVGNISSTDIILTRTTAGIFDNTGYNDTGINRGWVTIEYETAG